MLPEILLSLAGHPSEIWENVNTSKTRSNGVHDYISEPEKAMLKVLSHISSLHIKIKETAARLAASHRSVICRAVCSAINDVHLAAFRNRVLEAEAAILSQNAGYVGGYGIVPLSTIVSDFQPWTRRLEWLVNVTEFAEGSSTSGQAMLDWLHAETRTGYVNIEELARELLITGQKVWLRIAASWILYGRLPVFGADDFFVRRNVQASSLLDQYTIEASRVPSFISPISAESVLAIGSAVIHIQSQTRNGHGGLFVSTHVSTLMPRHLAALETLLYPINASVFEGVMAEIDNSISQNAVSKLLPLEAISRLLSLIHRFVLLGDGEFAVSLIENADARVHDRQNSQTAKPVRKAGRLDDLIVQDSELSGLLAKTWDEIAALQSENSAKDDVFDLARRTLVLRNATSIAGLHVSTLVPGETILELRLPPESMLGLFLSPVDINTYSAINAYLVSVRRTEIQLARLWKLSAQRRCYPTPLGPPRSASQLGQQTLQKRRRREASRATRMRQHWATGSKALFVLSELNGYFHGEVIRNSWECFNDWLIERRARPGSSRSKGSRPGTSSSMKMSELSAGAQERQRSDPRTLSQGHHLFLNALHAGLLLGNHAFVLALKDVLMLVDHYVALFSRLQSVWDGLDLEEDDGVVDAFSNFAQDEKDLCSEMIRSRTRLEEQLAGLVQRLRSIEKDRLLDAMTVGVGSLDLEREAFLAWTPRTMDRLVTKLDFLSGMRDRLDEDDGIMNDD